MNKMISVVAFVVVFLQMGLFLLGEVSAQAQDFTFSGNSKESYQCFYTTQTGRLISVEPLDIRDSSGYWLCGCNSVIPFPDEVLRNIENIILGADGANVDTLSTVIEGFVNSAGRPTGSGGEYVCPGGEEAVRATLKPPKLQQIEVWFIRIIYVIWALVASLSFFLVVALGYQYMISRGDVTKVTEIRQKIINYFIGLVLVFLSVPILITIFRLLGINQDVDCYNDIQMPGFQFFFEDLCTANGQYIDASGNLVDP